MFMNKNKIIVLLFLSFSLLGCDAAKKTESPNPSFELVSPKNNSLITFVKMDTNFRINFIGKIDSNQVRISINGSDVTSLLTITTTRAVGEMTDIEKFFQSGKNSIQVISDDPSIRKDLTFFLDDISPRIQITSLSPETPVPGESVVVSGRIVDITNIQKLTFSSAGVTQTASVNGQAPNQTFSVTLPYPDRSETSWVTTAADFTYTVVDGSSGQSVSGSLVARESRFNKSVELFVSYSMFDSFEVLLDLASIEAITTVNSLVNRAIDPLSRSWPSGIPSSPNIPVGTTLDFSVNTLPGCASKLSQSTATPDCVTRTPSRLSMTNVSGLLESIDSTDGTGYCTSKIFDASRVDTCAIYITEVTVTPPTFDFKWRKNATIPELRVIGFFQKLSLKVIIAGLTLQPSQSVPKSLPERSSFPNQDAFEASLNEKLAICDASASERALDRDLFIETCRHAVPGDGNVSYTYRGSLRTEFFAEKLKLETRFRLDKGTPSVLPTPPKVFGFTRIPGFNTIFSTILQQPVMLGTHCDICLTGGGVPEIELFFNIGWIKNDGTPVGELIRRSIESGIEGLFGNMLNTLVLGLDDLLNDAVFNNVNLLAVAPAVPPVSARNVSTRGVARSLNIDLSASSAATVPFPIINFYALGARFALDGNTFTNTINTPVNTPATNPRHPLGTAFVSIADGFNSYLFVDKISSSRPIQFSMALSANVINQYLASAHTTGLFAEYDFPISGAALVGNNLKNASTSDDLSLRIIATTEEPKVRLVTKKNQVSGSFCFSFNGLGNCTLGVDGEIKLKDKIFRKAITEHVEVTINGAQLVLENINTPTAPIPIVNATVDITLRFAVDANGLTPLTGNDFVKVTATDVTLFDVNPAIDDRFVKAISAKVLRSAIEIIGNSKGNILQFSPETIAVSSIFGSDLTKLLTTSATTDPSFALPMKIGISFAVLDIDDSGDFILMALNLTPEKVAGCSNESTDAKYIMAYCLK